MIYQGDALTVLQTLPSESVQCCVTSPPYWGLRNYGVDGQLGLEKTPEEYVAKMVEVFREVRRVLRDDGTCWINLGDSYFASGPNRQTNLGGWAAGMKRDSRSPHQRVECGLKPKDLVGIPWLVAFALRADGWYLRSDIIWSKPNPMPESVTDRPTKAHEYLFLLSKSQKYYYDADSVREPVTSVDKRAGRNSQCLVDRSPNPRKGIRSSDPERFGLTRGKTNESCSHPLGRNLRSVWTIATQPFPEAHFATFPEKLVEPCVKAGSKVGDTVLDPFAGACTVGLVCKKLQREFIGIELSKEYCEMGEKRIEKECGGLI